MTVIITAGLLNLFKNRKFFKNDLTSWRWIITLCTYLTLAFVAHCCISLAAYSGLLIRNSLWDAPESVPPMHLVLDATTSCILAPGAKCMDIWQNISHKKFNKRIAKHSGSMIPSVHNWSSKFSKHIWLILVYGCNRLVKDANQVLIIFWYSMFSTLM